MSDAKLYYTSNYKTELQIWKENKEFERKTILMSCPPLDSTPIGTNTTNAKILHLESIPVDKKTPEPKPLTLPT